MAGSTKIEPGDRVHVACEGRLRGYAPFVEAAREEDGLRTRLVRGGGAGATTLRE